MIDILKFESIYEEKIGDFTSVIDKLAGRDALGVRFDENDLHTIEQNFYSLMYYRCRNSEDCTKWLDENLSELPKITNNLKTTNEPEWIAIPGMYGGFSYGLIERGGNPILVTDSWVRIVGGSGEQHEITPNKIELVARGFV